MPGIVLPDPTDEERPVKTWVLMLSTVLVAFSLLVYGSIFLAVPSFTALFAGFGNDLPSLTRVVLDYSQYTVVLALIGVVPLVSMWQNRASGSRSERRNLLRIIIGFAISIMVGSTTMIAFYLPIFEMGEAVTP